MKDKTRRQWGMSRLFPRKGSNPKLSQCDETNAIGALQEIDIGNISISSSERSHALLSTSGREDGPVYHSQREADSIKPMMARLDALKIQQQMQGMDHPDVLFALKSLGRAHMRRGEYYQAKMVQNTILASQNNYQSSSSGSNSSNYSYH